tara:strand:+ start:3269 stop:3547 length:279 start_codon:yes stop_codon:yes gene_type:complete
MAITKKYLSNKLRKETDLSLEDSSIFVDEFIYILSKALNENDFVKISGFGTFQKFNTKPRVGRNPVTMKEYQIPSKKKIKFLASNATKNMLN